jgi:hypothetical protein
MDAHSFIYRRGPWKIISGSGATVVPKVARRVNQLTGWFTELLIDFSYNLFSEEYDFRYVSHVALCGL